MENTSINELNALLRGEHMAIDGYERYIRNVEDWDTKKQLQKIQQDHKQHAIRISERIQNLGGRPVDGVGALGRAAEALSAIKDMGNTSREAILKEAYNGENNGIKMADEIVKGDLDFESKRMVDDILNDDRNHLSIIDSIINK